MSDEITTTILRQIRADIAKTNARLDKTNERLDMLVQNSAIMNERLSMVESGLASLAAHMRITIRDVSRRLTKLEKKPT